eukprot:g6227.t1
MKKKKTLYNSPWYCTSCGLLNDQSSTWACMKCGAGKPALSVELAGWDYRAARKVGGSLSLKGKRKGTFIQRPISDRIRAFLRRLRYHIIPDVKHFFCNRHTILLFGTISLILLVRGWLALAMETGGLREVPSRKTKLENDDLIDVSIQYVSADSLGQEYAFPGSLFVSKLGVPPLRVRQLNNTFCFGFLSQQFWPFQLTFLCCCVVLPMIYFSAQFIEGIVDGFVAQETKGSPTARHLRSRRRGLPNENGTERDGNTDYKKRYLFHQKQFWKNEYDKFQSRFSTEWYVGYKELRPILVRHLLPQDRLLYIGCGNSEVGSKLYEEGYQNITGVDCSKTALKYSMERDKEKIGMRYFVMDALALDFPSISFDCVLDKGLLDAVACDMKDGHEKALALLKEVWRILRPGGRFIMASTFTEEMSMPYLGQTKFIVSEKRLIFPDKKDSSESEGDEEEDGDEKNEDLPHFMKERFHFSESVKMFKNSKEKDSTEIKETNNTENLNIDRKEADYQADLADYDPYGGDETLDYGGINSSDYEESVGSSEFGSSASSPTHSPTRYNETFQSTTGWAAKRKIKYESPLKLGSMKSQLRNRRRQNENDDSSSLSASSLTPSPSRREIKPVKKLITPRGPRTPRQFRQSSNHSRFDCRSEEERQTPRGSRSDEDSDEENEFSGQDEDDEELSTIVYVLIKPRWAQSGSSWSEKLSAIVENYN